MAVALKESKTDSKTSLVSHYSAIGDAISCDALYSEIGFRDKLLLRYPPSKAFQSFDCDRPFLQKEVGV